MESPYINFASTKTSKRKHASFPKFEYLWLVEGRGGSSVNNSMLPDYPNFVIFSLSIYHFPICQLSIVVLKLLRTFLGGLLRDRIWDSFRVLS